MITETPRRQPDTDAARALRSNSRSRLGGHRFSRPFPLVISGARSAAPTLLGQNQRQLEPRRTHSPCPTDARRRFPAIPLLCRDHERLPVWRRRHTLYGHVLGGIGRGCESRVCVSVCGGAGIGRYVVGYFWDGLRLSRYVQTVACVVAGIMFLILEVMYCVRRRATAYRIAHARPPLALRPASPYTNYAATLIDEEKALGRPDHTSSF